MPNTTPSAPKTNAPADRLELSEASTRSTEMGTPSLCSNVVCFSDAS